MKNEETLRLAIEKAMKNGWLPFGEGPWMGSVPTLEVGDKGFVPYFVHTDSLGGECRMSWQQVLFSHDFAKAFFGEPEDRVLGFYTDCSREPRGGSVEDVKSLDELPEEINKADLLKHGTVDTDECCETYYLRRETVNEGWKCHLQKMVLEEDPSQYLKQFL